MKSLFFVALCLAGLMAQRRQRSKRRVPYGPGTVALITGASAGIGEQIALQLAAKKCDLLILVSRTESKLRAVAEKCEKLGSRCVVLAADISSDASLEQLEKDVRQIVLSEMQTKLSLLVLNAGRGAISPFDSTPETLRIARDMMDMNYFSNVKMLQLFVPYLESNQFKPRQRPDGGDVLVVGSVAGVLPSAHRSAYCASKHALQGFCNALRQEVSSKGVHITMACPSFVLTEFHDKVLTASGEPVKRKGHSSFMTPSRCAAISIDAAEHRDYEAIMTLTAWAGYHFRPFLPTLVDAIARKKALGTLDDGDSKRKSA